MTLMDDTVLFTIGHSNHTLEQFLDLLRQHGISAVGDVRSNPYSRFCPHFNQANLESALARAGVTYVFLGKELGARPDDQACFVNGRMSYERLAARREFREGLNRVRQGMTRYRLALMCAEKDPLECHRMILICRHLRSPNLMIQHILADGLIETNKASERRLCERFNLQPNLFASEAEVVEQAYERQAERIAFTQEDESETGITEDVKECSRPITIYTMGFTQKSAEEFFTKLKVSGIRRVVDVRLNNVSQLAGFTKKTDLEYFLREIGNIGYVHLPELAPTRGILDEYKKNKGDWSVYEERFLRLISERAIEEKISRDVLDNSCLLCSEATADHCHRRLVAEYLKTQWGDVNIIHL